MSNYTRTVNPQTGSRGVSRLIREEYALIETAVNSKADAANAVLTGVPVAPTAAPSTNTTQIATTAFVIAEGLSASLPGQAGNAGKFITTDGSTASWALPIADQSGQSGKFLTTNGTTTSWDIAIPDQTGNNGRYLTTDGTTPSWDAISTIPSVTGNSGKLLINNGTISSWGTDINVSVMSFADGSDATKKLAFDVSGVSTSTTRTVTIPNASLTMVGTATTQTLTNKTLTSPTINTPSLTVNDTGLTIQDNSDTTKKVVFQLSTVATGTTRTITVPNANLTLVGTDTAQTLTNKIIDIDDDNFTLQDNGDTSKKVQFQVSGVSTGTTRTLTVPNSNTTLVGTGVTQTLTNKTLTSPTLNTAVINTPSTFSVTDSVLDIRDNSDATKKIAFQLSGITTSTTRTLTIADQDSEIISPPWKLLSTVTASNDASVDVEWTASEYDYYILIADDVTPATNNTSLRVRFKVGGSYLSTGVYESTGFVGAVGAVVTDQFNSSQTSLPISGTAIGWSNLTPFTPGSVWMRIPNPDHSGLARIKSETVYPRDGVGTNMVFADILGSIDTAGVFTGVRLFFLSGNVSTGTFRLYGIRNT